MEAPPQRLHYRDICAKPLVEVDSISYFLFA